MGTISNHLFMTGPLTKDKMASNSAMMPPPKTEATDEQLRTLWVGGISDRVDEETLFELFINAGPLQSVRIPVDRETKKQKPFAFVLFAHSESLPFAYELFRDIKLYGRPLRMQNKETGLGLGGGRGGTHSRANSDRNRRAEGEMGAGAYNRSHSDSDRNQRPDEHLSVTLSQHHRSVSVPTNFQQGEQPIYFQQQLQQQQYQQYNPNFMPGTMNFGGNQPPGPMFDGVMQQQMLQQQGMFQPQFHNQSHYFQQQQHDRSHRDDQQRGASRGDRALNERDRSRSYDRNGGDHDRRGREAWDSYQSGGRHRDHGRSRSRR